MKLSQIYITEADKREMKRRAKKLRVSFAELVRRAIKDYLARESK